MKCAPARDEADKRRLAADQGGRATRVWVNTSSRVYHCPGTKYYGTTARGEYLLEREAVAAGYRAAGGKTCGALTATAEESPPEVLPVYADMAPGIGGGTLSSAGETRVRLSLTSRVYYCPGSAEYGTPERGVYMVERDARLAAFQPATGQACTASAGDGASPASEMPLVSRDAPTTARPEAPASGATKVWVNTKSRVYRCPGTRYFGTTANGAYMTERDAMASGYRAAGGRTYGT